MTSTSKYPCYVFGVFVPISYCDFLDHDVCLLDCVTEMFIEVLALDNRFKRVLLCYLPKS